MEPQPYGVHTVALQFVHLEIGRENTALSS